MADFKSLNGYNVKDEVARNYVNWLDEEVVITDMSQLSGGNEYITAIGNTFEIRLIPLELLDGKNFKYVTLEFKNGIKWKGLYTNVFADATTDYYKYDSFINYVNGKYSYDNIEYISNGLISVSAFNLHGSLTDYITMYINFTSSSSYQVNGTQKEFIFDPYLVGGDQTSLSEIDLFRFYELDKIKFSNKI